MSKGDVFDSATPPASAERMWFEWLAAAKRLRPELEIVAIAGNHDSPARLGAAASVLRELGVHVIGSLPRRGPDELDLDRILIPVRGGIVAAVPFLRPIDLGDASEDPLADVYRKVVEEGLRRRGSGALIVLGHLYAAGADPSYLSERRISIGGQESASLRMFPPEIDYVALGHMHRAQRVLRETIRYAGAPIALALDEASYHHQILIVDLPGEIRSIRVPQQIEIIRIPARGAASVEQALAAIAALPPRSTGEDLVRPYLDLMIALEKPEPRLRSILEQALEGKRPRLVQLRIETTGSGAALADRIATRLAELDPRDVFLQLWARDHAEAPSPAVLAGFDRLLSEARGDLADPARPKVQLELGGVG
ncbi:MAG TPA: exonuclease SbcCD subunit D C-terminal domain-containing protein [Kofleriaceae bacterium]